MTPPVRRPVLRYHGGKFRLAPWVISQMPPHRVYTEAFGGAASVLLQKPRVYGEVYNDLDGEIVNVFRVLRDPATAEQLRAAVALTPYARAEHEAALGPAPSDASPVERARRVIVRAFMGFGSDGATRPGRTGFRSALSRQGPAAWRAARKDAGGQTPATDWHGWPQQIPSFVERLRGVVIEERPALDILELYDAADCLHYVDPPYVHATRERSHGYRFELSDLEHRELAAKLAGLRGMVMLSGYRSPLYDELYAGWSCLERPHRAHSAKATTEVLWFNAPAWNGRLAPGLF